MAMFEAPRGPESSRPRQALDAVNCSLLVEEDPDEKVRPEFNRLLGTLQAGDVLAITS